MFFFIIINKVPKLVKHLLVYRSSLGSFRKMEQPPVSNYSPLSNGDCHTVKLSERETAKLLIVS